MNPRRKPIPSPIARPSDVGLAARPLAPTRVRSVLPTVAALLALGALGCENGTESIARDNSIAVTIAHAPAGPRATSEPGPAQPLPGMGALEEPPPPPPEPIASVVPPKHPYPVKGGLKAVHPVPTAPPAPGGPKAVTPIPPTPKAPKLGGDVAMVVPETT